MDKTRVIILAVAVGLLGYGGYLVYEHQNQKAAQEAENFDSVPSAHREAIAKIKKLPIASTVPITAQAPATGDGPPFAGDGATKSAVPAKTMSADTNSVAAPVSAPTAQGAAKPAGQNSKPAIANGGAAVPMQSKTTAATAATKPEIAQSTAAKPMPPRPVAAAPKTAPPPVTPTPPVAAKPAANSFPNGPKLAPMQPVAQRPAGAALNPTPAAQPITQVLTSAPAAPAGKIAATSLAEALLTAKVGEGRPDPMKPIVAFKPFPTHGGKVASAKDSLDAVPPPPDTDDPLADAKVNTKKTAAKNNIIGHTAKKINEPLVPPPPPTSETGGSDDSLSGLPIDQLPVPPSRPTIGDKLRVLAVLDNHAIVAFPNSMRIKNKWPKTLNLAQGEQFESITVIGVNKDGVTIEEDGERSLRPLSPVK